VFALIVFYLLLGLAVFILRGDLTDWPRAADRTVAFVVCLGAVALLLRSWRSHQPESGPAEDGSSRPRATWWWWAGVAGLAAFVFLAALPPVSVVLARPQSAPASSDQSDSQSLPESPPADSGGADIDPAESQPIEGGELAGNAGSSASATLSERLSAIVRQRSWWLLACFLALAILCAALLWWVIRRHLATRERSTQHGPPVPWHRDPVAPAYVREFCRLCDHCGCSPRPGDTWRELLGRLRAILWAGPASAADPLAPLDPVARYHYQVRYEGVQANQTAEREFTRLIRVVRKAATFPPATETTTAE